MIYKIVKRMFDILFSSILFIIISPLFLTIMVMVKINIGSPVFFKQERSGLNQKIFKIIKFRSMTNAKDNNGNLLPDDIRLTKLGKFLRSSSLDELPELLSIIKGDMSIIGPRPLPPSYDKYYTMRELKRFDVRGGLIPPDSVDSTAFISWDEQLEYEAEYAEALSFKKDIRIMIYAIRIILTRNEKNYGAYVRSSLIEERTKFETKR